MSNSRNILITGGSGMIGSKLTSMLVANGHHVSHLGRSKNKSQAKTFLWDPSKWYIDAEALSGIDTVIHLAGAGIADKRWTAGRKNEILLSRTESSRLLSESLRRIPNQVTALIAASGISFYGLENRKRPFVEDDLAGSDFMARVTVAWEKEVDKVSDSIRLVKIRTGVVLSESGIAMKKLTLPVKLFVGAPLGSGQQYVNWIHIDDVCRIYLQAVENVTMHGAYNAVAPNPVTNKELTLELARVLKRPLWAPPVPEFLVKLIAGEVADVVLHGGKISAAKLEQTGFKFRFEDVRSALEDLLTD